MSFIRMECRIIGFLKEGVVRKVVEMKRWVMWKK